MLNYVLGALLAIAIACGGFAYYEHTQVQKMAVEVGTYKSAAAINLKAKEDADASCLITVDTLNKYYKDQKALETSQQAAGDTILSLPTLTIKEKANAAPMASQPVTPGTRYSDDDRLSPDTMRLLDSAYCDGNKDDCATPAK